MDTLKQMGKNAFNNPGEFVGYGLNTSCKAVKKSVSKVDKKIRKALDKSNQNFDANLMRNDSYDNGYTVCGSTYQMLNLRKEAQKQGRL